MDEHLWEQVFRYAIRSDWNAYKTFQMVSKMTAVIADRVVGQHPIPESLKPDWQGNEIFPPIRNIGDDFNQFCWFSSRIRFARTVQMPFDIGPARRRAFIEAIVFKTKPQTVHIRLNEEKLIHIEPHNGIVWLGMLPAMFANYTFFQVSTTEPCEVDLIWHEYGFYAYMTTWKNDAWFKLRDRNLRAWFKLGDRNLQINAESNYIGLVDPDWHNGRQNWLSIYIDFLKWAEDLYDNRVC